MEKRMGHKQVGFWANETDIANIQSLKNKTGLESNAELMRFCLTRMQKVIE